MKPRVRKSILKNFARRGINLTEQASLESCTPKTLLKAADPSEKTNNLATSMVGRRARARVILTVYLARYAAVGS